MDAFFNATGTNTTPEITTSVPNIDKATMRPLRTPRGRGSSIAFFNLVLLRVSAAFP